MKTCTITVDIGAGKGNKKAQAPSSIKLDLLKFEKKKAYERGRNLEGNKEHICRTTRLLMIVFVDGANYINEVILLSFVLLRLLLPLSSP